MEKNKLILIVSAVAILLVLFGAVYYYQSQKTEKSGPGSETASIENIQFNLEQETQKVVDAIREKFMAERKKIQESSMTQEEKDKAMAKLDQEMNKEIIAAVEKLNSEADKALAKIREEQLAAEEKAKKVIGETTFATKAESGKVSQIFAAIKVDEEEIIAARENQQAVINFLALENFDKDDSSSAEKLIAEEIAKIKPALSLPGSYFEVPIE